MTVRAPMTGTRAGKLVLLLLALAAAGLFQAGNAGAAGPIGVVCTDGTLGQGVRSFDLQATSGHIQTPDGNSVFMWSFAPNSGSFQSPGPILCANEGEVVTVTLRNNLPEPVSIVFPGQTGVTASGGAPGLFTRVAATAGGTVSYTFTAGEPGTYLYESGTSPHKQIEMGLYGALIVRPALGASYAYNDPSTKFDPAREYLLLLHDIDPALHAAVEQAQAFDITTKHDRYYTVNGRMFPDTIADNGAPWLTTQPYGAMVQVYPYDATINPDPALIRYANAGLSNHPMHPHGNHLRVIARDGRVLPDDTSYENFTRTIGSGQTTDLLYWWTDAERWRPTTNPVPVAIPSNRNLFFKDDLTWYSGSPYLGYKASLPAGVTSNNRCGEYYFPLHSHALNEFVNFNEGFGGMATLLRVGKDFTISATPVSRTVIKPGSATYTVTIARTQCFSGFPTLSASGLPPGASASFSALSGTGAPGTSSTSTLTITTTSGGAGNTPTGSTKFTIAATSSPIVDTNTLTLNVLAPLAPSSVVMGQGTSSTGGVGSLATLDGSAGAPASAYFQVTSNTSGNIRTASWCATFGAVTANPIGLAVTYEGSNATATNVARTQTVWIRNWNVVAQGTCPTADNAWVQLDLRPVASTDVFVPGPTASQFILALPTASQDFVNGSGEVRVRIRSTGTGQVSLISRGDWLRLGHG